MDVYVRRVCLTVVLLTVCFDAGTADAEPATRPPNIVLIMADDLGYECIGANGSEYKTPNLDRLAERGVRFTNCFANPLCTPSRVKIMTGMYNVRNYTRFGELPRDQTTFAHQLKQAGYATAVAGKWQLGKQTDSPRHFGFEQSCLWQHTRGRKRKGSKHDSRYPNPALEINGKAVDYTDGQYGPQVCTDFLCTFIEENRDRPFLAYYPMILTHCPFVPTPDSPDWDPADRGSKSYKGDAKYFPDMVAYMDRCVGQIVEKLDALGLLENTLVVFTGDNGTDKPVVTMMNGRQIAGGKGTMTDEGTRVPLIAHWPAVIEGGRVADDLVDFTDVLPTLCEVAGARLPKDYPGDGVSLVPTLRGQGDRDKPWVYIWYRGKVLARNREYMLVGKQNSSQLDFLKYKAPYQPQALDADSLTDQQQAIRDQLQAVIDRLAGERNRDCAKKPGKGGE